MFNVSVGDYLQSETQNERPTVSLDLETIILSFMLSFFCVLGTVGNALAFIIYYRKREKGTSTIFILSLAATDFLTCLINLPYTIISLLLDYRLEYDILCKMFLYISTFNVPLSSLILVAIGIDRYLCICHPFLHVVTVSRAKMCVLVLTFLSALLGIVPALSHYIHRQPLLPEAGTRLNYSGSFDSKSSFVTTIGSTPTTRRELIVDGLFLQPDREFMKALVESSISVTYRTENVGVSPINSLTDSIEGFVATTPVGNIKAPVWPVVAAVTVTQPTVTNGTAEISENLEGVCVQGENILSSTFIKIYQHVYAGTFLFDFIVLAILYLLIYRSIHVRRAWKSKQKQSNCYPSYGCNEPATAGQETQMTTMNGGAPKTTVTTEVVVTTPNAMNVETVLLKKNSGRISSVMRDRTLHANIKTAAMLFVVTLAFIISFLPSWLMGLRVVPLKRIVFYMFYINNVINPFIYAFMNQTFRDDLFQLLKNCFRR